MTTAEILSAMEGQIGLLKIEATNRDSRIAGAARRILSWLEPAREMIENTNATIGAVLHQLEHGEASDFLELPDFNDVEGALISYDLGASAMDLRFCISRLRELVNEEPEQCKDEWHNEAIGPMPCPSCGEERT